MASATPLPGAAAPTVVGSVEAFLAARDLAAGSARLYHLTLTALAETLGLDRVVGEVEAGGVAAVVERRWG
jgi:hypothetical protein